MDRISPGWLKAHDLLAFVLLAFAITFAGWAWLLLGLPGGDAANIIGLWGPAIAAVIVTALTRGRAGLRALLGSLLKWRVPARWYLLILLGWPAIGLFSTLLYSLITGEPLVLQWNNWAATLTYLVQSPLLLFWACEELGWRGFALPRLLGRWNALIASTLLGIIWGLWHLPYFVGIPGLSMGMPLPIFLVFTIALSILMTWVYQHTGGSVFVATLFHFWVNIYDALQADKLALANPGLETLIRYGLLALVTIAVVALFGYRTLSRKRAMPAQAELGATGA